MRLKILIIILIVYMLYGCANQPDHVDFNEYFSIKGMVFDHTANAPLGDVEVFFIDKGFYTPESKYPDPIRIGKSDKFGNINLFFLFIWGREYPFNDIIPQKNFSIMLKKIGYRKENIIYNARDLDFERGALIIMLNKVYLEPE